MRIWRIDTAFCVILLVLGFGFIVVAFSGGYNPAQAVLFIFIGYIMWTLAFLFSNLSLIEKSVENLPNWTTGLLAWMGMPKAVDKQIENLKESISENDKQNPKRIVNTLNALVNRSKKGLRHPNYRVRKEALEMLGRLWELEENGIIGLLVQMLKDKNTSVRRSARLELVKIGPQAVEALRNVPCEGDEELALEVDKCLKIIGDKEDIEQFTENAKPLLSERLKEYFQIRDSIQSEYSEITFVDIDVAESTGLKEGEPKESVVYSFGQYNEIIYNLMRKHSGEEFNRIGDEQILLFENPTDAAKMGIELQSALLEFNEDKTRNRLSGPFKVRLGINTGDCLIDPMLETSDAADYTLDIACHLQKYGEPDTVYISENTYSKLELEIKNRFEGPVEFQKDNIKIYTYAST